jgi:hypothetical protein
VRWVSTDSNTLSTRLYTPDALVCGPAACVVGSSGGFRLIIIFINRRRCSVLFKVRMMCYAFIISNDANRRAISKGLGRS